MAYKSKRKLHVWGGGVHVPAGQAHVIVADYTKKAAYARLYGIYPNVSRYRFDGWWSETGNKTELKVACEPGVWIEFGERWSYDYRRLSERCPECGGKCRGPFCNAPPDTGEEECEVGVFG